MAETITIICPECEKAIKAPDSVVGKKIRCKGCGETFTAKAPKESSKGIKPAKDKPDKASDAAKDKGPIGFLDDEEGGGAYGVKEEYLGARCPECAEKMGDDDVICLACGYSTITRTKPTPKRVRETTGGDIFLHLLPGILCAIVALFFLAWFVNNWIQLLFFYELPEAVAADRMGRSCFYCCITWLSVFQIWIIYKSGKFAVKRLIINNKPEEIEEELGEDDDDEDDD